MFGVDFAHHTLVLHQQTTTGEQWLRPTTRAPATRSAAPVRVDDQYVVIGGRVDAKRHRAVVLASRSSDRAGFALPVNTATGAQGTPFALEPTPDGFATYGLLDVDESTGVFSAQKTGSTINCLASTGSGTIATVDLDSATVAHSAAGVPCAGNLASDQNGNLSNVVPLSQRQLRRHRVLRAVAQRGPGESRYEPSG